MQPDDLTRRAALAMAAIAVAVPASAGDVNPRGAKMMERVTGIGGFFFRAKDPKGLAKWYDENLGVSLTPQDYGGTPWRQEAGTTVFEPFPQNTSYFGDPSHQWMINFRVTSLDRMAAQLRAKGIKIEIDPEIYPNGRFAKVNDPEGNPIQLWEPDEKDGK